MYRYLLVDFKVMMRVPMAVFFSLVFPLFMTFVFMTSYGNIDIGGGYHLIDKYFLIATGMGVLPSALISFPIRIANLIEDGSLKRLTFLKLRPAYIMASGVLMHFIMGFLTLLVCFVFACAVYGLRVPTVSALLLFLLHYLVILAVSLLAGAVIALCFPKQQVVLPLGMLLMFLLFLFCGIFGFFDKLPEFVQAIGNCLPMKYGVNDLFDVWQGRAAFVPNAFYVCAVHAVVSVVLICGLWHFRKHKL